MAKANKDGWIRHCGGKRPVENGTLIDMRFRGIPEERANKDPQYWDWDHIGAAGDIMAYRICKPEDAKQDETAKATEAKEQRSTDASYLVAAAKQGVELAENLRARYLATFEEKKALEVTIAARQNDVAMIEKEQEELRRKVRALGFDFYDAPTVEDDMSDPKKWKAGDFLTLTGRSFSFDEIGDILEIEEIIDDKRFKCKTPRDDGGWAYCDTEVKFHSRPK